MNLEYDAQTRGRNFGAGELVWVYSLKKGFSPKLMPHWTGPCTVLEQLSDVVYQVRLMGRTDSGASRRPSSAVPATLRGSEGLVGAGRHHCHRQPL